MVKTIRQAHQLEKEVDDLDVKIGLLVHNRITLQVMLTLVLFCGLRLFENCQLCLIQTDYCFSGGAGTLHILFILFCLPLHS